MHHTERFILLLLAAMLPLAGCLGSLGSGGDASPRDMSRHLEVAVAAKPPEVVLGAEVTFTAKVQGNQEGLAYEWSFGDGGEARGTGMPQVAHAFTEPGSYIVRLTVTAGAGASAEAEVRVAVNQEAAVAGNLVAVEGVHESEPFTTTVTAAEQVAWLRLDLAFSRASAGPATSPLDAAAEARVLAADGTAVLHQQVTVPEAGARLAVTIPAAALPGAGAYTLEVAGQEGAASFSGVLVVGYAADTAS